MSAFFTLPHRGLIHVEGNDRFSFLQKLITNDLGTLREGHVLYACLLTPQGKFLHDFFIHDTGAAYLLDCEGGPRAQDLYKRLNLYRLRADIQISVEENVPVYAGFSDRPDHAFIDPRHESMGWRSFQKPVNMTLGAFNIWDMRRIKLCVPDGSRDLTPDISTLAEGRIDQLNGVSYDKGCYVGQELTARMHYRGLSKKHLYTVQATSGPLAAHGTPLKAGTQVIGEMRSSCGPVGLAALKDSEIAKKSL
jgi:folate-binding protein YgfZ